jgi:hypothetical protein
MEQLIRLNIGGLNFFHSRASAATIMKPKKIVSTMTAISD